MATIGCFKRKSLRLADLKSGLKIFKDVSNAYLASATSDQIVGFQPLLDFFLS